MNFNINYKSKFIEIPICLFETIYGIKFQWALEHYEESEYVSIPLFKFNSGIGTKVDGVRTMLLTDLIVMKNSVVCFTETEGYCFLED
ncbi:hypothetical protein ES695_02630 [Candidatus Atribacteria bacterium 1244-E10-H5-B2]|nr:MAG: hypothetical protein ES695_02630 [Candidatus Atribacteria bacterium 1244-E10-H5-B2]